MLALVDAAEVGKAKAEFLQSAVQLDARLRGRAPLQPDRVAEKQIQDADAAIREARARVFTAQQALLTLGLSLHGDEAALPDDQLRDRLRLLGIPADVARALPTRVTTANLLPVVAPFDGTVIDRKAVRGESVTAHQPLFTVSDLRTIHVLLDFRPEDAGRLALRQRVEFRPDGDAGPPAVGELHWISPSVDEKTRLIHAHAEVPNPTGRLRREHVRNGNGPRPRACCCGRGPGRRRPMGGVQPCRLRGRARPRRPIDGCPGRRFGRERCGSAYGKAGRSKSWSG